VRACVVLTVFVLRVVSFRLLLWVLSFYYCFSNVYSHMLAWGLECVGMCGILYSALRPNALADYILDLNEDDDPHLHSLHNFLSPPSAAAAADRSDSSIPPSPPSPLLPTEATPLHYSAASGRRQEGWPRLGPIRTTASSPPPPPYEDDDHYGAADVDDDDDEDEDDKAKRYSRQTIN
jgi:hypothetical protein